MEFSEDLIVLVIGASCAEAYPKYVATWFHGMLVLSNP